MGGHKMEANLSTLIFSIGTSSLMNLGLAPNPSTGKMEKNMDLAKMNIDLLLVLKEKTKGNLTSEEDRFLISMVNDLQLKFVEESKK
jgi:hypothetical protein